MTRALFLPIALCCGLLLGSAGGAGAAPFKQSVKFNGSSDYAKLAINASFQQITVGQWVRVTGLDGQWQALTPHVSDRDFGPTRARGSDHLTWPPSAAAI